MTSIISLEISASAIDALPQSDFPFIKYRVFYRTGAESVRTIIAK
jgi:hypothetical protein